MQRYILNNDTKTFYDSDIHHITKVMRMKSDDKVIVCLEEQCYLAQLNIESKEVDYVVLEKLETNKTPNITLIQGLIKGNKLDTTIKYSTIFGVKKIILTEFERSISKLKNSDFKIERYFNIAKEAAELAHREMIPEVSVSNDLTKINWDSFDYILVADEEEKERLITDLDLKLIKTKKIAIIIGPEGGISNKEREFFKTINSLKISLGKYIFPAEIAAISLLNTLNL